MGSPRWIRRELAVLSVTDGRRERVDDVSNHTTYVGFPTVFIFGSF
jgi:hypothetical protein